MASSYKFIDHTADIAADVEADSMEELFAASAEAWKQTIFEDANISKSEKKVIDLAEADAESLLVKFLTELNYLFQTKRWICSSIKKIKIIKEDEWNLSAVLLGEPFDPAKHAAILEIKAVTFHQMEIKKIKGKYSTRIVFDI